MTLTSLVAAQSNLHPGPDLPGQVTSTGALASTCRKAVAICSSENLLFFIAIPPGLEGYRLADFPSFGWSSFSGGRQSKDSTAIEIAVC